MSAAPTRYSQFIAGKSLNTPSAPIPHGEIAGPLFPFQRRIVTWALDKGRAAIFADCGMGKTLMQLTWAAHCDRTLLLAPLAVAHQTVAEAKRFGIDAEYARDPSEAKSRIVVTNYERLEKFLPWSGDAVVLDESSILKAYDGKTRTMIIDAFSRTPHRLACTATPAPNDFMELGNHAQFLGVMTREEMLAMYFTHDGGDTSKWRLKGHAEHDFWRWICGWAVTVRKPSDIGFSDDGFVLPELRFHEHVVKSDAKTAFDRGLLFDLEAKTLQERRAARKGSLSSRVKIAADIVSARPDEPWLVWCNLNDEGDALESSIPGAVQVAGSDDIETKTQRLGDFTSGAARVLVSKPSIAGWGMNWQHCRNVVFVGLSDSFEELYQAVRRCWRFGQKRDVNVHVVIGEAEGAVLRNIQRKEADAQRLGEEMVRHMSDLQKAEATERDSATYERSTSSANGWEMRLGDCVDLVREVDSNSIDYTIFSPPFTSLYTYSNSERDMGNCKTHSEFYEHFAFLVPELLRVTKPGRLLSFHCMNLPTSKARDGVIGLTDFRGLLIKSFQDAGWIYHSEVVIWKDPVTAMQRTKALGLLYKQLKKDSSMSRQGIPDFLVTMRKPGVNSDPVTKDPESFPVDLWQRYASPVWMDVDASRTLQSIREDEDEKHICPLQLDVIERAIRLWTNPGDLVLSPFAGIGSEGYVALQEKRRFLGFELKRAYYDVARKNLQIASTQKQLGLFDAIVPSQTSGAYEEKPKKNSKEPVKRKAVTL
jgi:DNA modification methylase